MRSSHLSNKERVEDLRELYGAMCPFHHEGAMVYIVAHVMWTSQDGVQHWVFKLNNKKLIKVDCESVPRCCLHEQLHAHTEPLREVDGR